MFIEDSLGYRLKLLRKQKGMSVREVAETMGVSSSYISMVENGKTTVSLRLLRKLLPIYGESVGEFLQDTHTTGRVRHLSDMRVLHMQGQGMEVRTLRAEPDPQVIHPYYFCQQPGVRSNISQHTGTEFLIVLEGELTVSLIDTETNQEEVCVLQKLDSIHYLSSWPHSAKVTGNTPCTYLIIHSDEEPGEK